MSDAERYSRDFGGENWLDQRRKAAAYIDHDPAVLVESTAANLKQLKALYIDCGDIDQYNLLYGARRMQREFGMAELKADVLVLGAGVRAPR